MRNETMEMKPLSSLPSELKIQFDNMINSRKVVKITKKDEGTYHTPANACHPAHR